MPEPTQPTGTPEAGGTPPAGGDNNGGTPPAKPADNAPSSVDLTKLSADDLNKVLENPNFFNIPRVKELREKAARADQLEETQRKAAEDKLKADKKWEELSTQKEAENATLKEQIQTANVNQALMGKLAGENAVDLDAALKLIDRTNISVDANGTVTGVDEAINSLKTDKAYLFSSGTQPKVGGPSNPGDGQAPSGPMKFKRSQLTQEFINANKDAVYAAMNAGQIEDDGPPPAG